MASLRLFTARWLRCAPPRFRMHSTGSASGKRRELPPTIHVSDRASEVIGKLMGKNPSIEGVKVGFDGVQYQVTYAHEGGVHTLDEIIEIGDAKVIVDYKSFGVLVGRHLDFDNEKKDFVISEPKKNETS
ncbi:hypothetical protein AAMO2058_000866500 [Amorphochlora amoebiformis]